jgi:hypothetical protein
MKVLARISGHMRHGYIIEIEHRELEDAQGLDYGKFATLKEGDEINLAEGPEILEKIAFAMKGMEDAVKRFDAAKEAMLKFATMIMEKEENPDVS